MLQTSDCSLQILANICCNHVGPSTGGEAVSKLLINESYDCCHAASLVGHCAKSPGFIHVDSTGWTVMYYGKCDYILHCAPATVH